MRGEGIQNPNGCSPKMTYFNSLTYSNYSMVRLFGLYPALRSTFELTKLKICTGHGMVWYV
jgi:hypothetical protein